LHAKERGGSLTNFLVNTNRNIDLRYWEIKTTKKNSRDGREYRL